MTHVQVRSAPGARRTQPRAYFDTRLGRLLRRAPSRPETTRGERVYAVGDVHGRLDLLDRLLKTIEADAASQACSVRIVFLGDLIDRGPHSREVLERVRLLERSQPGRIVALLGNHEEMLLAGAHGDPGAQQVWLRKGGDETLRSFGLDPAEFAGLTPAGRARVLRQTLGADMVAWLKARPLSWRSGEYFFCHAGVRPGVPLNRQRREDLLWIRHAFLDSERDHGAVIVHGHSETDEAAITSNRINVDTGAYRSGELTALGLQGPCRWLLSTTRGYLSREDLDAAVAWSAGTGDEPATAGLRARSRIAIARRSEAA